MEESPIPSRARFPWRPFIYAAFVLYLVADLRWCQGPLYRVAKSRATTDASPDAPSPPGEAESVVATVNTIVITREELDRAATDHLFAGGQKYRDASPGTRLNARIIALERTIDEMVIEQYSKFSPIELPEGLVDRRLEEFRSQFTSDAEFQSRLKLQKMSAEDLHDQFARHVHMVLWIESKIAEAIQPTEEEIRDWFEENADSLRVGDAIRASHIFLSTVDPKVDGQEEQMLSLHAQLSVGTATFDDLAAKYSNDARTKNAGGDLDWFTAKRVPEDFFGPVSQIPTGQIGQPFQTSIGWHIVRVDDRADARIPALHEVRDEIELAIEGSRRDPAIKSMVRSLRKRANIHYYQEAIRFEPPKSEPEKVVPAPTEANLP